MAVGGSVVKEVIEAAMREENIETTDIPDDLHIDPSNVRQVRTRDCKRYCICRAFASFDSHADPRPIKERDNHTNTWKSAHAWCTIDLKRQRIAHRWSQQCRICEGESYPWYDKEALQRMARFAVKMYLIKTGKIEVKKSEDTDDSDNHRGRPHQEKRCAMCKQLGHSCVKKNKPEHDDEEKDEDSENSGEKQDYDDDDHSVTD